MPTTRSTRRNKTGSTEVAVQQGQVEQPTGKQVRSSRRQSTRARRGRGQPLPPPQPTVQHQAEPQVPTSSRNGQDILLTIAPNARPPGAPKLVCFHCKHKIPNSIRQVLCENCFNTFHEMCVQTNSLFGMQANVLNQANETVTENEEEEDKLHCLVMTLRDMQMCNTCTNVMTENYFNLTKDGLKRSCLAKDIKYSFGMFDMCGPRGEFNYVHHITWEQIVKKATQPDSDDSYNSIAELLFDLKKFDHKKRIVNHFNAEIVEKCDYLQAYAQREATMMHECISCYACYYKQLIENGPKPLYTKTVTEFGGAFLSSCQNPHSVVWIKMPSAAELDRIWKSPKEKDSDTVEMSYGAKRDAISKMTNRWFPGKVMPHCEPYSLTLSETHVKVRIFGPQILLLVDIKEQKLFQYSEEMPTGGGGGARGRLTKFQSEAIDEANYYLTHLDKQRFDNTIPEDPIEFSATYLIMDHLYIDEKGDFKTITESDPKTFRGRTGAKAFWICWLKDCNNPAKWKLHNPVSTFCCPEHKERHNHVESTRKHFGRTSKTKKK